MNVRHLSTVVVALAMVSAFTYYQSRVSGQTDEIAVKVTSVGDRPISFRGAIVFRDSGLQLVEGQTPFEVRGHGGVALAVFDRQGDGPEIRVELSTGQSSAAGTAGRVIVGHDVVRGVSTFARTF